MNQPTGFQTIDQLRAAYSAEDIHTLVHTFYSRVREDEQLAPVFDARIEDWDYHLGRMVSFWGSVLRSEPGFKPSLRGSPPELHQRIAELENHHFDQWLELFGQTVREIFSPEAAEALLLRARRIAVPLSGFRYPAPEPEGDQGA